MPKVLLYDIEANNLAGDIGFTFCIAYKWADLPKIHVLSVLNTGGYDVAKINTSGLMTDKYLIEQFAKIMETADLCVGHYSSKFDHRFINTRLLLHKCAPMADVKEFDNWWNAKVNFKFHSNRAEAIGTALGVSEKIKLDFNIWRLAGMGHIKSIKYIEQRCISDIKDLDYAYKRMSPFASFHPRLYAEPQKCPQCGSASHIGGTRLRQKYKYRRYQCNNINCGHWFIGERIK